MRRNGSGHITVVLPLEVAPDTEGAGLLQTQAGSTNKALFRSRWWEAGKFSPAGGMGGRCLFVYRVFSEWIMERRNRGMGAIRAALFSAVGGAVSPEQADAFQSVALVVMAVFAALPDSDGDGTPDILERKR